MVGYKQTFCALLLTMITGIAIAQNNTNSPYTRYGFGDLSDQYFGNSKAMGGIAYGLRDGAQINVLNPASYTAIDSLTFLFEGGVTMQNMNISGGGVKLNAKNSSLDYLAMQFRLQPWMAMSIGLLPYSSVGYSVSDTKTTDNGLQYSRSFTGDGGLHQLYLGLGMKLLKNLSVGMNVSYFWGDITRVRNQFFPNESSAFSYQESTLTSISDYKLDFGVQYTQKLNEKGLMTFGAVYTPKKSLKNDFTVTRQVSTITTVTPDATLEIPNTFGVGVTYKYDRRLTVGMDYSLQKWSKVKSSLATSDEDLRQSFDETYAFSDRSRISVGAEYIPNLLGRSYLAHVKYRVGVFYSTPYYKIEGKKASTEFGVTAGFGLPVPRSRSILSISGQFVHVKGKEVNMLNENIFRVSIGLTFNERWFFKRRVE